MGHVAPCRRAARGRLLALGAGADRVALVVHLAVVLLRARGRHVEMAALAGPLGVDMRRAVRRGLHAHLLFLIENGWIGMKGTTASIIRSL